MSGAGPAVLHIVSALYIEINQQYVMRQTHTQGKGENTETPLEFQHLKTGFRKYLYFLG